MSQKKLSEEDLKRIHSMRVIDDLSYRKIAKKFGVHNTTVCRRYKEWMKDVPPEQPLDTAYNETSTIDIPGKSSRRVEAMAVLIAIICLLLFLAYVFGGIVW